MSVHVNLYDMTVNGKPMNEDQRNTAERLKEVFEDIFFDDEDDEEDWEDEGLNE